MMNFLTPLFLAGAAAVALPLIFHLIRRSSREKVPFSSLMFLEPSPPRLTRRSRLEHLLLLLLRALVVCLLALAFARPFLPKAMPARTAQAGKERVAILVDASASMRREDLWSQARARAAKVAGSLKPDDALAVYTFDQELHGVLNFAESARLPAGGRAAAAEARLRGAEPGWAGTHLGHALLGATEQLVEDLNSDAGEEGDSSLRLVVISDFQAGAKLEGLQGFEWPKKLAVQLEPVAAKELFNASLQILDDPQRALLAPTGSVLRVRVQNAPDARGEQFQIFWGGAGGPAGGKTDVYVPPGQSRIVSAPPRPEGATSLRLVGDAVELDNTVWSPRPTARAITVAYWGSEPANDPNGLRYYIHRAFEQTNLATRVLALSNAAPAEARGAAFLILGETPPAALGLARELLAQGRTVLLPMRGPADANAISELAGGVLAGATEAPVKNYALFGRIDFQNPLFAPFADARFSDFTKIHFWKHRVLNAGSLTNLEVPATFDSGSPALAALPVGRGRLLVLGTTWKPSDSQLALSSKFVPLLFGMLEQSAGLSSSRRQFSVGDTVALPGAETNRVTLPDGSSEAVEGRAFTRTERPGIYQAGDFAFAVNLDPAESRLTPLARDELASLGVPIGGEKRAGDPAAAEKRERRLLATEAEARQKLWRWCVVAALGLLLIETWYAGRLSRAPAPA